MSDQIGDRLLMFDNTGGPSLELLRFRPELADAPGFEAALRDQVQRLAAFQHPAFASVRSVERLEPDDDLALISNHTPGKRLSEILHRAKGPALAAALIKQLAPAIAQFQQQNPGAYRGVLSPDRIVVSPEARMTIVEHVVAAAIGSLNLPEHELASLGFAPPAGDTAGEAGDWYQLGIVALSGLIGRVVTAEDLPRLDALVEEAFAAAGPDAEPLAPFIRHWLGRALQATDETPRLATGETQEKHGVEATEETQEEHGVEATEETQKKHGGDAEGIATEETQEKHWDRPLMHVEATSVPAVSAPADTVRHAEVREVRAHRLFIPAETEAAPRVVAAVADDLNLSPFEREVLAGRMTLNIDERAVQDPGLGVWARVRDWRRRTISLPLAAAAVIAAGEAGVIGWMAYSRPVAQAPAVAVHASPSGEHLLLPGASAGPAAVGVAVAPDFTWVRVTSSSADGVVGQSGSAASHATVRITSPIELKVLEGSRVLGSVPGRDLELPAGQHDIELVNDALGYRARQTVPVEAGQLIAIHISPPPGQLVIEAPGGPEVSVDGKAIGRAPQGPLALTPGEHQVTFTYQGGRTERQRITVKSGSTSQVVGKGR